MTLSEETPEQRIETLQKAHVQVNARVQNLIDLLEKRGILDHDDVKSIYDER